MPFGRPPTFYARGVSFQPRPRAYPELGKLAGLGRPPTIVPAAGTQAARIFERAQRVAAGPIFDPAERFARATSAQTLAGTKRGGKKRARKTRKHPHGKVSCSRQTFRLKNGRTTRRMVCRDSLGRLVKSKAASRKKRSRKRR